MTIPPAKAENLECAMHTFKELCPPGADVTGIAIITKSVGNCSWSVDYQTNDTNLFPAGDVHYLQRARALLASHSAKNASLLDVTCLTIDISSVIFNRWQARYRVNSDPASCVPPARRNRVWSKKSSSIKTSKPKGATPSASNESKQTLLTSVSDTSSDGSVYSLQSRLTPPVNDRFNQLSGNAESHKSQIKELTYQRSSLLKLFKNIQAHNSYYARRRLRRAKTKSLVTPINFVESTNTDCRDAQLASSPVSKVEDKPSIDIPKPSEGSSPTLPPVDTDRKRLEDKMRLSIYLKRFQNAGIRELLALQYSLYTKLKLSELFFYKDTLGRIDALDADVALRTRAFKVLRSRFGLSEATIAQIAIPSVYYDYIPGGRDFDR